MTIPTFRIRKTEHVHRNLDELDGNPAYKIAKLREQASLTMVTLNQMVDRSLLRNFPTKSGISIVVHLVDYWKRRNHMLRNVIEENISEWDSASIEAYFERLRVLFRNEITRHQLAGFQGNNTDCLNSNNNNNREEEKEETTLSDEVQISHLSGNLRNSRGSFPAETIQILRKWFLEHLDHPYPSAREKERMARDGGISYQQVGNWFVNVRMREWRPLVHQLGGTTKSNTLNDTLPSPFPNNRTHESLSDDVVERMRDALLRAYERGA